MNSMRETCVCGGTLTAQSDSPEFKEGLVANFRAAHAQCLTIQVSMESDALTAEAIPEEYIKLDLSATRLRHIPSPVDIKFDDLVVGQITKHLGAGIFEGFLNADVVREQYRTKGLNPAEINLDANVVIKQGVVMVTVEPEES